MFRLEVMIPLLLTVSGEQHQETPLAKAYDFIVVGGGTAGAVIANRLSEIKDWTVLLLEAGGDEGLILQAPLFATSTLVPGIDWGYRAEETPNACQGVSDHRCALPKGKVLGGTSSINFMVYTRGNRRDYNSWEAAGNSGWGYKDVLPYFLKSENQRNQLYAHSRYHAVGGPLTVDTPNYHTPASYAFLQSVRDSGYPIRDYNGAHQFGFQFVQAMVRNGRRCSSNKAFLNRSVRRRPNLTISTRTRVTRLLLEGLAVIGVELLRNGKKLHIRARKEVILSAGTLNDPQILMLSGIGPQQHLQEVDIPVVKNLSVGLNLQDHVTVASLTFALNKSIASLTSDVVQDLQVVEQWLAGNGGPLSVPGGVEAIGFVSTKLNERGPEWPDLEIAFTASVPHLLPWMVNPDSLSGELDAVVVPRPAQPGFTIVPFGMRPRSRGAVRLRSKDPIDPPQFYLNHFSDHHDMQVMLEGLRLALRIAESPYFKKLGAQLNKTRSCERLQFGTDAYWECRLRMESFSLQHQVGTCKMGPASDPDAVVDSRLRVHGIRGLRVVDASIMPTLTSCHTASVAIMIGEKGSDMIKQDWGVYSKNTLDTSGSGNSSFHPSRV